MSQRSCSLLVSALASATFANKDIESQTINLIKTLEAELDEAGFEPGSDLEEAEEALEEILNETDMEREELDAVAAASMADASNEEDSEDGDDSID